MTAFSLYNACSSQADSMDYNARIQAAIDDLRSQKRTNIAITAKKYEVARETLLKRFRGETG